MANNTMHTLRVQCSYKGCSEHDCVEADKQSQCDEQVELVGWHLDHPEAYCPKHSANFLRNEIIKVERELAVVELERDYLTKMLQDFADSIAIACPKEEN